MMKHICKNVRSILLLIITLLVPSHCFICNVRTKEWKTTERNAVKIDGYDDAFQIIDECAISGKPSDKLYDAVRFVDKNVIKIYPDLENKQELWKTAYGSWKLQLATGGGKFTAFKPVPIFAFAMIDEENFGNGIGWNEQNIILSLLGPHDFNEKRRQMLISIDNFCLFGSSVTNFVPGFLAKGIGLGKRPSDFKSSGQRPPAFTFIGASDNALIARGGTGGIAIWTRLQGDIRPAAYGTA
mmetsp:Transcript_21633/g.31983  ORF Transcript_21633/g.31983 Transcript_21633/m.31983 type:complete len:241 (-) Transcript_21633:191-913(-)|eukprot:CAMPEP_0194204574 /NCGR_PEP_ID=MMETSP0156-20130528/4058_1 /TAXON_ID=33649 /ORGANISM="Thalassionema nitzschioides, Strain L26-B" /LENGTH=240 /DNA_ID=CAMNT_0038930621 /DNA_START=53 /DNA_END=775 /DNA_ORIENTATION=+